MIIPLTQGGFSDNLIVSGWLFELFSFLAVWLWQFREIPFLRALDMFGLFFAQDYDEPYRREEYQ